MNSCRYIKDKIIRRRAVTTEQLINSSIPADADARACAVGDRSDQEAAKDGKTIEANVL